LSILHMDFGQSIHTKDKSDLNFATPEKTSLRNFEKKII
jgi:hypothetical protein